MAVRSCSFLRPVKIILPPFTNFRGFARYPSNVNSSQTRPDSRSALENLYPSMEPAFRPRRSTRCGPSLFFFTSKLWQAVHFPKVINLQRQNSIFRRLLKESSGKCTFCHIRNTSPVRDRLGVLCYRYACFWPDLGDRLKC